MADFGIKTHMFVHELNVFMHVPVLPLPFLLFLLLDFIFCDQRLLFLKTVDIERKSCCGVIEFLEEETAESYFGRAVETQRERERSSVFSSEFAHFQVNCAVRCDAVVIG